MLTRHQPTAVGHALLPRSLMAAGTLGAGCVLGLSLHWHSSAVVEPIQCNSSVERRESQGAQSIEDLVAIHGRMTVVLRVIWRCVELFFRLAPVLCTLPLLRTSLRVHWLSMLRASLERCGPVGIKWGQWASTRYDIFEDDVCDELGKLTNAAPVHPLAWTEQLVAQEFGCHLSDLFADFSEEPVASGSIGQVHLATLKQAHGQFAEGLKVAVKVQHPNLAERLTYDMAILMKAADTVSTVAGLRINETVGQFASNFYMQLDFRDEAENLRRFTNNFGSAFWRAIATFPQPIEGGVFPLVSEHLIVETFEAGDSVAEYLKRQGSAPSISKWKRVGDKWVPAEEHPSVLQTAADPESEEAKEMVLLRKRVGLCGVQSYLKMVMLDNFVHADLHPGNVLVRMEEVGLLARVQRFLLLGGTEDLTKARVPHIIFLDAGLAAIFNEHIYSNVQGFFQAIVQAKGKEFGYAILGLAPAQPHVPSQEAFVLEVEQKMVEMRAQMEQGHGRAGDNIRSFMASVRNHQVTLDPSVMVALMSMMVLEGWQWRLDPSVGIMDAIEMQLNRRSSLAGWLITIGEWWASLKANG